jgi:hypothetical protein
MWNPIPDYLQDEDKVIYDIDLEYENVKNEGIFFRKLRYRLGDIVIFFNELERTVDECILEMMNDRGEDTRIWVLIKDFSFDKKISSLELIYYEKLKLYDRSGADLKPKVEEIVKEIIKIKNTRNMYIHANWLNHSNLEYFESKVKHIKNKNSVLRVRKKITIENIEEDISQIQLINERLIELHEAIFSLYI